MQASPGKGARFTAHGAEARLGFVRLRFRPMLLIRLLFLLLLAFIAWRVYRLFRPALPPGGKEHVERMVRCATCETHVPAREALQDGEHWFCSEAHKRAHADRPDQGGGE